MGTGWQTSCSGLCSVGTADERDKRPAGILAGRQALPCTFTALFQAESFFGNIGFECALGEWVGSGREGCPDILVVVEREIVE